MPTASPLPTATRRAAPRRAATCLAATLLALAATLLAQAATPRPAAAAPKLSPPSPIPGDRVVLTNLSIFRWNPIGLESQVRAGWEHKLFDRDDSPALRNNFLHLGTFLRFNPAMVRGAAVLELQPLSLLNLRFTAEWLGFFGNFTFLQSRPDASFAPLPSGEVVPSLADSAMKANKEGRWGNYASSGLHATFEPLLQARVGPIAVRSRSLIGWFGVDVRAGDRVFYEATFDTALAARGWVFANDADLLWLGDNGLTAGLRHSMVVPLYGDGDNPGASDNSHQRLCALVAYSFWDHGYAKFDRPTVLAIAGFYLKHRYRTGEDVSRAMPYVTVGFAFRSDLLDVK